MAQKKGLKPGTDLRYGYTTGTCAAAAAKAAALALTKNRAVARCSIALPGDGEATFAVKRCHILSDRAVCSVVKDAGDDPDITNGAEITATVIIKDEPGVDIRGGQGVGTVTKPGLEIPVGEAAINRVPQQMIAAAVGEILAKNSDIRGAAVIISVKDGEKMARKTLNARIGIVGGISIIGTTGIVIPYSPDAYKASISQALDIAAAGGNRHVVLTTGRRSEKFAQAAMPLPEECFIQAGDFIGHSLQECAARHIGRATIWGMTGKMSKLAAGCFYTNISDSKVDMDLLLNIADECGPTPEERDTLRGAVTANHLRRLLPERCVPAFCNTLCRRAAARCRETTGGRVRVGCILSDYDGAVMGRYDAE